MTERALTAGQKTLIDLGPLVVFFAINYFYGIMIGTAALMAATLAVIMITFWVERSIPPMPAITCLLIMVFGGLTLYFDNEIFIKIKPTIVNTLFAVALILGLIFRQNFLKILLGRMLQLTDHGWVLITKLWVGMFFFLAIVNEIVWRLFETDTWVTFKAFGIPALVLVFGIIITPLLRRHSPSSEN